MSVKGTAYIQSPDQLMVTVELTMSMYDWQKVAEQCSKGYPGWKLSGLIRSLVLDVKRTTLATGSVE